MTEAPLPSPSCNMYCEDVRVRVLVRSVGYVLETLTTFAKCLIKSFR